MRITSNKNILKIVNIIDAANWFNYSSISDIMCKFFNNLFAIQL